VHENVSKKRQPKPFAKKSVRPSSHTAIRNNSIVFIAMVVQLKFEPLSVLSVIRFGSRRVGNIYLTNFFRE
jgi:hypothetical protein